MGNKILQYGLFIALSEETGVKIINPSFAPYAHHFKNLNDDFLMRYPQKKSIFRGGKKARKLFYFVAFQLGKFFSDKKISNKLIDAVNIEWDKSIEITSEDFIKRLNNTKFFFLMGWDFRYKLDMRKHHDKIKKYFEPLDVYQANVSALIKEQRLVAELLIGVHIRQGDYKTFEGGKYFYETPKYVNMMAECLGLFEGKKIKFIVCSNEKQPKNLFQNLDFCTGTNHPVEDMYTLAQCDYILGPPSTFTMWASFYGNTPIYFIENPDKKIQRDDFKVTNLFQPS